MAVDMWGLFERLAKSGALHQNDVETLALRIGRREVQDERTLLDHAIELHGRRTGVALTFRF